jgi:hypothetical protein
MIRILAIVPVWKRPELTRACLDALARVQRQHEGEIVGVIGISPGDPYLDHYTLGNGVVMVPNRPLGRKHNLLVLAAEPFEWDYLWVLGSDTLVSPRILELYRPHLEEGVDRVGLRDIWFWDAATKGLLYFPGYGAARTDSMGAGRMIARRVVEACGWELWDDHLDRALDYISTVRMDAVGTRERCIYQGGQEHYLLEVRTEEQVTALSDFNGQLIPHATPPGVVAMLEGTPWALGGHA